MPFLRENNALIYLTYVDEFSLLAKPLDNLFTVGLIKYNNILSFYQ